VQVFSEYGYWESIHPLPDADPDAPTTRDTPDLVLFVPGPPRRLLVLVEAKLYHRPSRAALGDQLHAQAGLLTHLADRLQVPSDGRAQLLLVPEQLATELGLVAGQPAVAGWPQVMVRTWQELLQVYRPVAPAYWVEVLALALDRYPRLRSERPAPRANAWTLVTGAELLAGYDAGTLAAGSWVGRGGGASGRLLEEDLASGAWRERAYEWSGAPTAPNRNWLSLGDFAQRVAAATPPQTNA
jgi:hypothetical protein